jgi:hypothetical protein
MKSSEAFASSSRSSTEKRKPCQPQRGPIREKRIHNEVVVDAYGPKEQARGWYYYLEDKSASRQSVSLPEWFRRFSKEQTGCRPHGAETNPR